MEEGRRDEEVVFFKKKTEVKTRAKIDTLFMTKTAEKPYPLGPHIPIQPISASIPPGLKYTKCHAVRTIHRIPTEILNQTY